MFVLFYLTAVQEYMFFGVIAMLVYAFLGYPFNQRK